MPYFRCNDIVKYYLIVPLTRGSVLIRGGRELLYFCFTVLYLWIYFLLFTVEWS